MFKKSLSFVLALTMVVGMLCGCSNTQAVQNESTSNEEVSAQAAQNEKTSNEEAVTQAVQDEDTTVEKIKVDKIVKNAKVYTSDMDNLNATAFAVKDGKFVYVGDEEGLKDYEGEEVDMGGKTILPTFMDGHVHLPACVGFLAMDSFENISGTSKAECLEAMKKVVDEHPEYASYTFMLQLMDLGDEDLTKEDLDAVCADKEVFVIEGEGHSSWSNSLILKNMGITDDTQDKAEGLSFLVRDKDGHITGNAFEGMHSEILMRHADRIKDEDIESEFTRWINFCKETGVSAVFEAGTPGSPELTEHGLEILCKMDEEGKLPIYIDASYMVYDPAQGPTAIEELVRQNKKFNTEHVKVDTLKLLFDGTLNIRTANMVTPYNDTQTAGGRLFDENQVADFLKQLNELGFNLHTHCVGEGAIKTVLDGVEIAKKELGDDFKVKVTIAHNEIMRDEDIPRFKELGVIADFTPWWHSGACISGGNKQAKVFLGERANKMYRSKSVWDTGAIVTWSSDTIQFGDFASWNPMLGFEVGMTREIKEDTKADHSKVDVHEKYPEPSEEMSLEEMILGYTINVAKQLGLDDRKGSIEAGKDADYIVFDEDLFNEDPSKFSHFSPREVWFAGEQIHTK